MAIGEAALTKLAESGAEKAADGSVSAFGALMRKVRQWNAEAGILLGDAFRRYLDKAYKRYNQVTTLATGIQTRCIFGSDSIYVKIGVAKRKKPYYNAPFDTPRSFSAADVDVISTETADTLLSAVPNGRSRNILILGTGGAGKSMLMRYLFLKTVLDGSYVPVMLELRKISAMEPGSVSLEKLLYICMDDFDTELKPEFFQYSLRQGKYLFLLDGLEEVQENMLNEALRAIEKFLNKYPENACVMTSRPMPQLIPLEIFTVLESMPMNVPQAVELARKLWESDEKTAQFCYQLENGLFGKHQSFAETPLLLSILYLTFMRNASLPEHLAEFYEEAYEALYSTHDINSKGYYTRDFKSKLNKNQFKIVFARFCFQTFFQEKYEFAKEEIVTELQKNLHKFGFQKISAEDYLFDLRRAVCMIVKDGPTYHFAHPSFQTYFAAYYTASMTDAQQKQLFERKLYNTNDPFLDRNYYTLLAQIEPSRFGTNVLEQGFRRFQIPIDGDTEKERQNFNFQLAILYLAVISGYAVFNHGTTPLSDREYDQGFFMMMSLGMPEIAIVNDSLEYIRGYSALYQYLAHILQISISETRAAIGEWLDELDRQRQSTPTDSLEDF